MLEISYKNKKYIGIQARQHKKVEKTEIKKKKSIDLHNTADQKMIKKIKK